MERYVSRKARRKWAEELEVLEYNELEKRCDEIVRNIEHSMKISEKLIGKGDRDD